MDQTPLSFTFADGHIYADKGEKSVWVRGGQSGLEKRQCTVQLTIFADCEPRIKPFLIFKGQGKRISLHERARYDRRAYVQFQANAWCDEAMMKVWINQMWKPACIDSMLLVMDVHRGQTTDRVKSLLEEDCATNIIYVPSSCTSLVQPLNVSFNKPFKVTVERLSTQHMQDNLEDYHNGNINACARRVLFAKWVGEAWEEVRRNKDMIIRSFKKTGIAIAADGSEDNEINIEGLTGYTIESEEEGGELDSDDSEDDPFADTDCSLDCDND